MSANDTNREPGTPGSLLACLTGAAFLAALAVSGCRLESKTATVKAQQAYRIGGALDLARGASGDDDTVSAMILAPRSGERRAAPGFHIDPLTGEFTLAVSLADVDADVDSQEPVTRARMGLGEPAAPGGAGAKILGHVRLELSAGPLQPGKVRYTEALIPIERSLVFQKNASSLVVKGTDGKPLTLNEVGVREVLVTSETDQPINGARLFLVPLDRPSGMLRAVAGGLGATLARTDSSGRALLYPIGLGGQDQYQVIAEAPGYCRYVSTPAAFGEGGSAPLTIALTPCPSFRADGPPALAVRFPSELTVEGSTTSEGVTGKVLFHGDRLTLDLTPSLGALRGIDAVIRLGDSLDAPVWREFHFATFRSELELVTPTPGTGELPETIELTIELKPHLSGPDQAAWGEPKALVVSAATSRREPSLDPSRLVIMSAEHVAGVISGRPGARFFASVKRCPAGGALAVTFADAARASDLTFVPCQEEPLAFTVPSTAADTAIGGPRKLRYFFKDRYGNVNASDALRRLNEVAVYVDYGVPDLASGALLWGTDFGLVRRQDAAAEPAAELELDAADLRDYAITFAEGHCRLPSTALEDGPEGANERGTGIHSFRVARDQAGSGAAFVACGTPFPLTSASLNTTTGEASFYLTIRDLAGHESKPELYRIPACGVGEPVCIKP